MAPGGLVLPKTARPCLANSLTAAFVFGPRPAPPGRRRLTPREVRRGQFRSAPSFASASPRRPPVPPSAVRACARLAAGVAECLRYWHAARRTAPSFPFSSQASLTLLRRGVESGALDLIRGL